MISLRKAATELERLEELQQTLAKCYALAIKSSAEYAVELDPHSTEYFRQRLQLLDAQCSQASAPEHYNAVQASLRGELRNYRDQAREQMTRMRKDLQNAAAAMKVFAESVSNSGDDCEQQLRVKWNGWKPWPQATTSSRFAAASKPRPARFSAATANCAAVINWW